MFLQQGNRAHDYTRNTVFLISKQNLLEDSYQLQKYIEETGPQLQKIPQLKISNRIFRALFSKHKCSFLNNNDFVFKLTQSIENSSHLLAARILVSPHLPFYYYQVFYLQFFIFTLLVLGLRKLRGSSLHVLILQDFILCQFFLIKWWGALLYPLNLLSLTLVIKIKEKKFSILNPVR